jgi:hypothetical protein
MRWPASKCSRLPATPRATWLSGASRTACSSSATSFNAINVLTGIRGLHEPPRFITTDPEENRRSARRLATLEPKLVLFGHGPPLRETRKLVEFVDGLSGPR